MSHQATAWVSEIRVGDPTLKSLLYAIAHRADRATWSCWPSLDCLAYDTEVSKRTIQRRLEELEKLGFIRIEKRRRPDGTQDNSLITITGGQIVTLCPPVDKNSITGGQKPGVLVDTVVHHNKQEEQEEQESFVLKGSKPKAKKDEPYSEDFQAIWQQYPRTKNTSKSKAWDIYRMLNAERQAMVRSAVPLYAAAMRAENCPEDKIKHFQFWLTDRRYETAAAPTAPNGAPPVPVMRFWEYATEKQWANVLLAWSANWQWSESWGPAPDKPGCHVPQNLLDRFDLKYRGHLFSPEEKAAKRERVNMQLTPDQARA
jgi:hypothetical protein